MPPTSKRAVLGMVVVLGVGPVLLGCSREPARETNQTVTLVFKHGKIFGNREPLKRLIERFEARNPGIRVKDETLPASSDEQHQFYVINLEGRSSDFDVFALDIIWVPEFARAGWLRDISHLVSPEERKAFFPGPMAAALHRGRLYAIPWYIDAGLLYYRKDLLAKYGFAPPQTWEELARTASAITRHEPGLYGFIWQGKQYEGLVCNVLEYFWSNGGAVLQDGRVVIDSPANRHALAMMRDLIYRYRITPEFVTTITEEPARRIFGLGKALFMRNWPYAWTLLERADSPVKGRVGLSALPAFAGHRPASTLGGWHLGINTYTHHPDAAERFLQFLTSSEAQKTLSVTIGYRPTRRALYADPEVLRAQPVTARLAEVFEQARPRPVSPFYMMISQVMQPEFSAVLARIKEPDEALRSARERIAILLRAED
ncbi:MAG: ABC transporter substrate-binding protein [Candidatus Tectimicrobiota bacterium]